MHGIISVSTVIFIDLSLPYRLLMQMGELVSELTSNVFLFGGKKSINRQVINTKKLDDRWVEEKKFSTICF